MSSGVALSDGPVPEDVVTMKRLSVTLFAICLIAATASAQQPAAAPSSPARPAAGNTWRVDSAHSSAGFSVKHMMVATVRGTLGPISGTVEYDGKDVSTIKADIRIDVTKINTGNAARDKDLRDGGFFEVDKHPTMTFKSSRVQPGGAGTFHMTGDLTMHGVTKEVTLEVEGPSPAVKVQNGRLKVGATATTKINRRDFGLNYNSVIEAGAVVGDEVTVTIDIELNK
jgi:polyisoprenoid-binding protein YceI